MKIRLLAFAAVCGAYFSLAPAAWAQGYFGPGGGYDLDDGYGSSYYGGGGFGFFSQLVSQEIIPGEPLPPARVSLTNSSREPIVVWLYDLRSPGRGVEQRIPPGASVDVVLDRDAGGILQQVYHVRSFRGVREEVTQTPLPPRTLYNLVAFAERTQLMYRDPKGISGVPDYDEKNAVGLGVFEIPPGAAIGENVRLDVPREAAARNNPGAVAGFQRPLPLLTDQQRAAEERFQPAGRAAQPAPRVHTVPALPQSQGGAEEIEDS
ncbi:MAG TPA: hypothetical protein VGE52_02425 [Pirellulales bacterium]